MIIQPRFLPHLALSIDYFDISIDDTISTVGPDTLAAGLLFLERRRLVRAHPPQSGQRLRCGRAPASVVDLNTNIGSLSTKGVDLSLSYTGLELGGLGEMSFNLVGTYLDELTTCPGINGIAPIECAGKFSGAVCGVPSPDWRHHFRMGWETPWNVDLSLTWRYYGAVTNIATSQQANIDYKLGAQSYFDLVGELGGDREGVGAAGYQQRAGQGSADHVGRGRYRQRQHVPADLRRAGPLDLHARPGEVLIAT